MSRFKAYSLARSFSFAFCGIARSLRFERNLRIHFFAAAYVLYFSRYFDFSRTEYAILFAVIGFIIACELLNTAIETAVDLNAPDYSDLAKAAKDAAAGAVLVSSASGVAVGICFFGKPDILNLILSDIMKAPFVWVFLIAITIFLIAWPERRQMANDAGKNNNKEFS